MEHENSIFFSHLPLKEEYNKSFKSIPFLLFLELYCFVNIDNHDVMNEEKKYRNSEMSELLLRETTSEKDKMRQK